ncbi:hypothetical protein PPOP_3734, partial [Paenibacillus popilliae ATCC 14706]
MCNVDFHRKPPWPVGHHNVMKMRVANLSFFCANKDRQIKGR